MICACWRSRQELLERKDTKRHLRHPKKQRRNELGMGREKIALTHHDDETRSTLRVHAKILCTKRENALPNTIQ